MIPMSVRRAPEPGEHAPSGVGGGTGPAASSLPAHTSASSASADTGHSTNTEASPSTEASTRKLGYLMDKITSAIAFVWATSSYAFSAIRHPSEFFGKNTRNKFLVYAASVGTAAALAFGYFGFRSGKSSGEEAGAGNGAAVAVEVKKSGQDERVAAGEGEAKEEVKEKEEKSTQSQAQVLEELKVPEEDISLAPPALPEPGSSSLLDFDSALVPPHFSQPISLEETLPLLSLSEPALESPIIPDEEIGIERLEEVAQGEEAEIAPEEPQVAPDVEEALVESEAAPPEQTSPVSPELVPINQRGITDIINAELIKAAKVSSIKEFLRLSKADQEIAWVNAKFFYAFEVNGEVQNAENPNHLVKIRKILRKGGTGQLVQKIEASDAAVAVQESESTETPQPQDATQEAPTYESVQKEIGTALIQARANLGLSHRPFDELHKEEGSRIWNEANTLLALQGKPSLDKLCKLREELTSGERKLADVARKPVKKAGGKQAGTKQTASTGKAPARSDTPPSSAKNPVKASTSPVQQPVEQRFTLVVKDRLFGFGRKIFELYDGNGNLVGNTNVLFNRTRPGDDFTKAVLEGCIGQYDALGKANQGYKKYDAYASGN